jgi:hypothetical protein
MWVMAIPETLSLELWGRQRELALIRDSSLRAFAPRSVAVPVLRYSWEVS